MKTQAVVANIVILLLYRCFGGILRVGNPLKWHIAKPVLQSVRTSGIKQFINHYERSKDVKTPLFLWGDELEYGLFRYDVTTGRYDLSMRGKEIKEQLVTSEEGLKGLKSGVEWQPEFGSWMIEAVPRDPYGGYISDLFLVEKNMKLRRKRLHAALQKNEIAPSTGNFPMMGVSGYQHTENHHGPVANSAYLSDEVINPHPRFGTLVRNIRSRRQGNVDIRIPKADAATVTPLRSSDDCGDDRESQRIATTVTDNDTTIHMDAMAFVFLALFGTNPSSLMTYLTLYSFAIPGMGCCCLQITMQARDDRESRFIHDQLATMAPLMLALSASTPIFKGQLAGTDARWDVISQSVDDRTAIERGEPCADTQLVCVDPELVGGGVRRLAKSRYSSVSQFIGKTTSDAEQAALKALNDIDANVDEEAYQMLIEGGIDESLASHIAHLFTRDPLVIFDDAIYLDDNAAVDHFENIQSTNWRTMRWKTPSLAVGHEAGKRKKQKDEDKFQSFFSLDSRETRERVDVGGKVDEGSASESSGNDDDEKDIQSYGPGWRVEFRPLEIQLTDFENAAFSLLTVLTTRCMLAMGYNFYLPISLVEENMRRAQLQNAVIEQKFWVRKESFLRPPMDNIPTPAPGEIGAGTGVVDGDKEMSCTTYGDVESGRCLVPAMSEITPIEMSLHEFFTGNQTTGFLGLIPAIYGYLAALGCDASTIDKLRPYLTLLQNRASGELPTAAQWMRTFVRSHPGYIGNGIVTPEVANDLLTRCDDIGMGRIAAPELLGDVLIEELMLNDASEPYLLSSIQSSSQVPSTTTTAVNLVSAPVGCTPYNPLINRCRTGGQINRRCATGSRMTIHDTPDSNDVMETKEEVQPWSLQGLIDVTSSGDCASHADPAAASAAFDKYLKSYQ